jgi:hypothetical protein
MLRNLPALCYVHVSVNTLGTCGLVLRYWPLASRPCVTHARVLTSMASFAIVT